MTIQEYWQQPDGDFAKAKTRLRLSQTQKIKVARKKTKKEIMRTLIQKTAVGVFSLAVILTAIYPVTAFAAEPEQKTVRVGYVNVTTYEEGGAV